MSCSAWSILALRCHGPDVEACSNGTPARISWQLREIACFLLDGSPPLVRRLTLVIRILDAQLALATDSPPSGGFHPSRISCRFCLCLPIQRRFFDALAAVAVAMDVPENLSPVRKFLCAACR